MRPSDCLRRHRANEERRQHAIVAQVLTPCLELLRVLAQPLAELGKGGAQAVRVEVRQACGLECLPEDRADRGRRAPVSSHQTHGLELPRRARLHERRGEQRIVVAPQLLLAQVGNPGIDDLAHVAADREEVGREALAELRVDFARVLKDAARRQIEPETATVRSELDPGSRLAGLKATLGTVGLVSFLI